MTLPRFGDDEGMSNETNTTTVMINARIRRRHPPWTPLPG
jgi:hypothetical protein